MVATIFLSLNDEKNTVEAHVKFDGAKPLFRLDSYRIVDGSDITHFCAKWQRIAKQNKITFRDDVS